MLSPQSPSTYSIPLPAAPQSNCLNFKLIIRYKGREQSLNVPSFEDISNLYKIGNYKILTKWYLIMFIIIIIFIYRFKESSY